MRGEGPRAGEGEAHRAGASAVAVRQPVARERRGPRRRGPGGSPRTCGRAAGRVSGGEVCSDGRTLGCARMEVPILILYSYSWVRGRHPPAAAGGDQARREASEAPAGRRP
jgi:hypothetical protein